MLGDEYNSGEKGTLAECITAVAVIIAVIALCILKWM